MPSTDEIRADLERVRDEYSKIFDSYFKYCSDDKQVINSIFKDQKIRFSQPRVLNDPLEFNPTMRFKNIPARYQQYDLKGIRLPSVEFFFRVQLIESQINKYGILSLTKIPDSFDMWSRYSNGHRGFVIEFKEDFGRNPCMKSKSDAEYSVRKVEYVEDYTINVEEIVDQNNQIPIQVLLDELFFKKTSRWSYENEYRMVRPLSDSSIYNPPKSKYSYLDLTIYLFSFDWQCVSSIILGANMSKENKNEICQCCREHNIHLSQAHIVRDIPDRSGTPSMVYINSSNEDSFFDAVLKSTPPQIFCTDTIRLSSDRVVKINDITELPYYAGYEEAVDELYHNLKSRSL